MGSPYLCGCEWAVLSEGIVTAIEVYRGMFDGDDAKRLRFISKRYRLGGKYIASFVVRGVGRKAGKKMILKE